MIRALIFIAVLLVIDLYAWQAIRFSIRSMHPSASKIIFYTYWAVSFLCFGIIVLANFTDWHVWPKALRTYSFAVIFILFLSKLFISVFLFIDDAGRLIRWAKIRTAFALSSTDGQPVMRPISRSEFLVKAGLIIGAVPFFSLIWGMIYGAYRFTIKRIQLEVAGLPDEFRNFRIVHISDVHTGSFHTKEPLQKAVQMINRQNPDVIFITGDLVNDRYDELDLHHDSLKSLKAKHGIYSVLGNHDYGDYYRWESEEEKRINHEKIKSAQRSYGWKLLMDEHDYITVNGIKLGIIGVQNWSGRAGFQRYGNLEKAISGLGNTFFNILLSHDPSHWRKEVLGHEIIHLTLSGHTHGMQFGIEIPGLKWSPSQYFYREWSGLYSEGKQRIYVNNGLGFIGYPGRVGIMPEITVIELIPEPA